MSCFYVSGIVVWNANKLNYGKFRRSQKIEYKPTHKTCNITKSDITPLKLHENRFVIDSDELKYLINKIKRSVKIDIVMIISNQNTEKYEATLKLINEEFEKFGFRTDVCQTIATLNLKIMVSLQPVWLPMQYKI